MFKNKLILISIISILTLGCTENFSKGERIGLVTQFSKRGLVWKTWEGHLNITQTGMNSADGFDFSLDGDNLNENTVKYIDSAASNGWKVKLLYHQASGKNITGTRGETSYFIDSVVVLDREFTNNHGSSASKNQERAKGRVVDTIYIVIKPGDPGYKELIGN